MAGDVRLIRSPVSIAGMMLTTISAVLFLIVFLADLFGLHTNPYIGIVFFLLLPALFLVGLVLIPLGAWVQRRRRTRGQAPAEIRWPRMDLNNPAHRTTAVTIFALTLVNVIIVSLAAYKGVEYMDSPEFCGSVCHDVMKPEYASYRDAPHSRVRCVACHIGPGAASFAQAKLNGLSQVVGVMRNNYPRPIPPPVRSMRTARDTCEGCHWPEQLHGDKVKRIVEYADNEANTESVTIVRVHVGGGSDRLGIATGIHWHMNLSNIVEFIATDDARQAIPYVKITDSRGNVREFFADGVTPEQLANGERHQMDCMDCHNRPAHTMSATAERAIDNAITRGEIPKTLPFIRRESVRALKAAYPTQDAGLESIGQALRTFYSTNHGDVLTSSRPDVERAVAGAQAVYGRNVFPEMNVQFGTYPNNIGHIDAPGCFRCHDDNHKTKEGKALGQECETCHVIE
jgi:nitrate/TMAO reductase-like tetraheme cytochrome c subunit